MLHPAPELTLQLNWWTWPLCCMDIHSDWICLLSSYFLRLFTCTVCRCWNVISCVFVEISYNVLHTAAVSMFLLLFMDSCQFLHFSHMIGSTCFILFLSWLAATLEVSFLPILIAFCVSASSRPKAVAGFAYPLTSVFCSCFFLAMFCLPHV